MKLFINEIEAFAKVTDCQENKSMKTAILLTNGKRVYTALTPNEVRAKIKKNFITLHI